MNWLENKQVVVEGVYIICSPGETVAEGLLTTIHKEPDTDLLYYLTYSYGYFNSYVNSEANKNTMFYGPIPNF